LLAGGTISAISKQFAGDGLSADSIGRHRAKHLPRALRRAAEQAIVVAEGAHGRDLLQQVGDLLVRARGLLAIAEGAGDLRGALGAIRETGRLLGLMSTMAGNQGRPPELQGFVVTDPNELSDEELATIAAGGIVWRSSS
jgi:hypothetical protein